MKVIAIRQMHGVYGNRIAGEEFDVDAHLGQELYKAKLVKLPGEYTVKAVLPTAPQARIEHVTPKIENKKR